MLVSYGSPMMWNVMSTLIPQEIFTRKKEEKTFKQVHIVKSAAR